MPTKQAIDAFLSGQRLAMIGVSRNPKAFANSVYRELRDHGYEMFPVHPVADEVEGDRCVTTVGELPDVDGAMIMVAADHSADVVTACADRGIDRVWLHRGTGPGSVSADAIRVAEEHQIEIVDGACPLMFLEPTGWIHRIHRRFAGKRIAA